MDDVFYYEVKPIFVSRHLTSDQIIKNYIQAHGLDEAQYPNTYYFLSVFDRPHTSINPFFTLGKDMRFIYGSIGGSRVKIGRVCNISRKPIEPSKISWKEKYRRIKRVDLEILALQQHREKLFRGKVAV